MFLMLARVNPGGAGTASRSRAWYIPHHRDEAYPHLTTGAHPVPVHSAMEADEGASVTVVVPESEDFSPTPKQEAELLRAHEEIERGEFVEGGDLLEQLRSQTED